MQIRAIGKCFQTGHQATLESEQPEELEYMLAYLENAQARRKIPEISFRRFIKIDDKAISSQELMQ